MTCTLTFILAMAGAVAVGNLYWAQLLLALIAHDLEISPGTAGFLITATQIGYAIGLLPIVPLGDAASRRIVIPCLVAASGFALATTSIVPVFATLPLSFIGL